MSPFSAINYSFTTEVLRTDQRNYQEKVHLRDGVSECTCAREGVSDFFSKTRSLRVEKGVLFLPPM